MHSPQGAFAGVERYAALRDVRTESVLRKFSPAERAREQPPLIFDSIGAHDEGPGQRGLHKLHSSFRDFVSPCRSILLLVFRAENSMLPYGA